MHILDFEEKNDELFVTFDIEQINKRIKKLETELKDMNNEIE